MAEKDLYATLGVSKGAPVDAIKKAYRKLARELHPDRNPGNKAAEERFKKVSYAYDILSDDKTRALYDEFGEIGLKEGFNADAARQAAAWQGFQGGGGHGRPGNTEDIEELLRGMRGGAGPRGAAEGGDFGDIFGSMFGGRPRGRAGKGQDFESEIHLTLAEALRGTQREFTLRDPDGTARTVKARIPPGAMDGAKVRLKGQGGPGSFGAPPGDLVLTVRVAPHPYFRVEGRDLHLDLPVTIPEAWHGAKVNVPTAEGTVSLRIPPKTQGGATLRVKGKGIATKNEKGDLYVHISLRMPEEGELDAHMDALAKGYPRDPRADITL